MERTLFEGDGFLVTSARIVTKEREVAAAAVRGVAVRTVPLRRDVYKNAVLAAIVGVSFAGFALAACGTKTAPFFWASAIGFVLIAVGVAIGGALTRNPLALDVVTAEGTIHVATAKDPAWMDRAKRAVEELMAA